MAEGSRSSPSPDPFLIFMAKFAHIKGETLRGNLTKILKTRSVGACVGPKNKMSQQFNNNKNLQLSLGTGHGPRAKKHKKAPKRRQTKCRLVRNRRVLDTSLFASLLLTVPCYTQTALISPA